VRSVGPFSDQPFVKVAAAYAKRLRRAGRLAGQVRIFEAIALIGESTEAARHAGQAR